MELDFTNSQINRYRMYGGNNGNKISIYFQGESYMLKFPPKPSKNPEMSYTNGCISEYAACHIFESLGIETQQTLLGRYQDKIVVACKDFTSEGAILKEIPFSGICSLEIVYWGILIGITETGVFWSMKKKGL